jgi:hypothetical protein
MLKAGLALALIGAVIYLLVRVVQQAPGAASRASGLRSRLRRPTAPDDDPRFLRELDEQVWREKRQRQRAAAADPASRVDNGEPTTTAQPPDQAPTATDADVEPGPNDEAPGQPAAG